MQHYKKCASTVQRACATRYRTTACEQRHAHHLQLGEKEIKLAADTKSGPQRSRRCQAGAALMMQHRVSFRGRDENAHMLHLIYLCNLKQARRLRSTTIWHTHRSRWPGTRAEAGAGLSSLLCDEGGWWTRRLCSLCIRGSAPHLSLPSAAPARRRSITS